MKINVCILYLGMMFLAACSDENHAGHDRHATHEADHDHGADSIGAVTYWCPMDTHIVQQGPGSCPICGMDLEPKPGLQNSGNNREGVYMPANVSVLSDIHTVRPVQKTIPVKLKVAGYIAYDESRKASVSAKNGGRLEKLYVKYRFQPVKKGQALFELFSHDLQTAQEEYLYLRKSDPAAASLLKAARNKLLLLGMTDAQINRLAESHHMHATTTVYSPYDGFVVEDGLKNKKAASASSGAMSGGAMDKEFSEVSRKELSVREGAYIGRGEKVFTVVNTDQVWAVFEVFSVQLPLLKKGDPVHVIADNATEALHGKIDFIEPGYKDKAGTARLRVYLHNKNNGLKIGGLVNGEIEAGEKDGLWIPAAAVYDLGKEKIVFVKKQGTVETKRVVTGYSSGKEIEVISGLSPEEEIAGNAQYLVDSESFIKIQK